MKASIDFETRNTVDIKAGAAKYAKTAEILCLSYSINDGPVQTWKPGDPDPDDLLTAIELGCEVHAHNAAFERQIWKHVCVPKYGWPEVRKWRCTLARALYCGLPASLDEVSKALGLSVKKDMAGRRVMLKMTKPRKPRKGEPTDKILWHESPELWNTLVPYCEQDVRTEQGVSNELLDLTEREWSIYEYDYRVNERGVKVDIELAEACIDVWNKYTKSLNSELHDCTFGLIKSATQNQAILNLLMSLGHKIAALDKANVSKFLGSELGPVARRILEIRQELAKSSVSKYKRMIQCADSDDRIRGTLQYHGAARTGRFAGRLIQMQNLARGILDEKDIEAAISAVLSRDLDAVRKFGPIGDVLASLIRNAIIPDEGRKFYVFDFSSIEARALAWAAGEKWLLDAFRNGEDVYKHMASSIYGVPYESVDKSQRFFGKTLVLGAGYGLGAMGLQRQLEANNVKTDVQFCQQLIDSYRKKNQAIKRFWYAMENAAVACVESGTVKRVGNFAFHRKRNWLAIRLPSGRDLHYHQPKLVTGKFDKPQLEFTGVDITGKAKRETTYSGKITENCIQGLCRDILVEALSRLEKAKYEVAFHVHDEVVCEVPSSFGSIEEVHSLMTHVPDWASGFPIGAEGFECTRYRK